jgi:hypothetical protein
MTPVAAPTSTRRHPDYVERKSVPPEWQAELERVVPRSDSVSWLKLAWYPGISYEPVGRWVVYEMEPNLDRLHTADCRLRHGTWECIRGCRLWDLAQESPRLRGRWVKDQRIPQWLGGERWVSSAMHSTLQWELYHETKCYPLLFWIIQGDKGGHLWRLDHVAQAFGTEIAGIEPPLPGNLPYAEWNQQVIARIAEFDRLRKWKQSMSWNARGENKTEAGLIVAQDIYNREQEYSAQVLHWLDHEIEQAVSDLPRTALPKWADMPRGTGYEQEEYEEIEQRLLTQTSNAIMPEE